MPYINWNEKAAEAESCRWISATVLKTALMHMASVNISVAKARQDGLAYWTGLNFETPFSEDRRFPRKGYVCLDKLDYPDKEGQMHTSLSFKELNQTREGKDRLEVGTRVQLRGKANEENPTEEAKGRDEPTSAIPNDVILSYRSAIANMQKELGKADALYAVWKFEEEFYLTWED